LTTIRPTNQRAADVRLALRLTYLTLGWMTVEGAASLWLGTHSHSLLLEGFGADSVIELFSAGVLLWRLSAEASGRASAARIDTAERQASQAAGCLLYALAVLVTVNSFAGIFVIHNTADTHESVWGILIGLTAKIGMPILAGWKLKVAARLGSSALRADAMEAITCGYLSVVLMIGLAVTRLLPALWWLDSAAALVLVPFLVKEGREAMTGKCSCGE
jgi:divalent metal cation (Fe/Co/Zn/Cd) transporter